MEGTTNMARSEATTTARAVPIAWQAGTGDRPLLLIGAGSGVVGALLAALANGLHPHPADFRLEATLQAIAQNPAWGAVHLTLILGLLLILGALLALTLTLQREPAATVGRFACLATTLGGALIFVSTAMDGFAMDRLARSWLEASPAERPVALRVADAFENAQYAVYSLSIVLFLGIGIFLYGLATLRSGAYPQALGWLAMLSGAGAFLVGVVQTLSGPGFRGTEIFFVLFSVLSTIWVLLMGVLMWRKARALSVGKEANS